MAKLNSRKKIIVIVPAYNEEAMIFNAVRALQTIRKKLTGAGFIYSIHVVNDGSKDNTQAEAERAGADRILRHKINMGLGAAIRTGLSDAFRDNADIVIKFDADLQHDPEDIPKLIEPILNDDADIVYGKRFERIEYRMPFIRKIGNRVFTGIMRHLTGWPLEDSQPGIFAVNRDYLEVFNLPGDDNYTQQILLDAYHKGMRLSHVSVRFKNRETGKSFVSLKYPSKVGMQILLVPISVKHMKIFGTTGLIFLLGSSALFLVELVNYFTGQAPKPVVHVNAVMGLMLFGMQFFIFGLLAELIVIFNRKK